MNKGHYYQIFKDDFSNPEKSKQNWNIEECGDYNITGSCADYKKNNVKFNKGDLSIVVGPLAPNKTHIYTGRVKSKQAWKYGLFFIDSQIFKTIGTWPAIWMSTNEKWPMGGEIDILERQEYKAKYGGETEANAFYSTIHCGVANKVVGGCDPYAGFPSGQNRTDTVKLYNDPNWWNKPHRWCVNWYPDPKDPNNDITDFYLDVELNNDGILVNKGTNTKAIPYKSFSRNKDYLRCCPGQFSPMNLIFNVAIGTFGGPNTFPGTDNPKRCKWGTNCDAPHCLEAISKNGEPSMSIYNVEIWKWMQHPPEKYSSNYRFSSTGIL